MTGPSSGAGTHQGSRASFPDMAASPILRSPMVRASGPDTAEIWGPIGRSGSDALEPAISVPCAICPMPAATAAPAPPDEPPGVMPESRGFLVSPWIRLVVNQRYENAGQLVRPRITA